MLGGVSKVSLHLQDGRKLEPSSSVKERKNVRLRSYAQAAPT